MTPVELVVEAFGSFPQRQTIDFSSLGGLLLIHGETGAGKTTILDAITFALYGKSSGGSRGTLGDMRSHLAAPAKSTLVQFTFDDGGSRYRFARSVSVNRRGGLSRTSVEVSRLDDGEFVPILDKFTDKEAERCATEIIGLTFDQFRQVVILPQGKFEDFLLAPSQDKEGILITLFGADRWQAIADHICAKAQDMRSDITALDAAALAILSRYDASGLGELAALRDSAAAELDRLALDRALAATDFDAASVRLKLAEQLDQRFAALDQCRAELERLSTRQPEIDRLRERLRRAVNARNIGEQHRALERAGDQRDSRARTLNNAKAESDAAAAAHDAALEQYNRTSGATTEIDALRRKRERLAALLPVYTDQTAARSELSLALDSMNQAREAFADSEREIQRLEQAANALALERERIISECTERLPVLTAKQAELSAAVSALDRLSAIEKLTSALDDEIDRLTSSQSDREQELSEMLELLTLKQDEFFRHAAASLAENLIDGQPCPVCGSLDHPGVPHGARKPKPDSLQSSPETDGIPELSAKIEETRTALRDIDAALASRHTQREHQSAQASELENSALRDIPPELRSDSGAVSAALEQAAAELESARRGDRLLAELGDRLKDASSRLSNARAALQAKAEALNEASARHAKAEALLKVLTARLEDGVPDSATLTAYIEEFDRMASALERERAEYAGRLESARTRQSEAVARLSIAGAEHDGAHAEYAAARAAFDDALGRLGFRDERDYLDCLPETYNIENMERELDDFKLAFELASGRFRELEPEVRDKTRADLKALESALAACRQRLSQADNLLAVTRDRLARLTEDLSLTEHSLSALEERRMECGKLRAFGETLRGDRGISLRRYVLGVMLDSVASEANLLLKYVHGGRFRLHTRQDSSVRNRKSGLELEVEDAFSGTRRPVAGLSGGEKFLVSLSLAMGLSAVVQSESTATRIDALFIDEGFGSLDPDSIDDALEILERMNSSVSLIAIISHVETLRERVRQRIEVVKYPSGSKLVIGAG